MNPEETTKNLDEITKGLLEAAIEIHEAKIKELTDAGPTLTPETDQIIKQFRKRIETFRDHLEEPTYFRRYIPR